MLDTILPARLIQVLDCFVVKAYYHSCMNKEFINPPTLPNWEQTFSQIVIVSNNASKTIYLSGQVSVDENQNLIGEGDLRAQALQAFQNLETALAAAGAKTSEVVKLNIYVKGYKPEDAIPVGEALRRYFPEKNLPASTWLGVQALSKEGFLIEVDAVAVVEL
jgi:enamine deaminase RidA (YjgF/YER057c/UK114 family)